MLERVVAVRDAVAAALLQLDLVDLAPDVVTGKINALFARLQVQQALGRQMTELQELTDPTDVLTALAVEVVSRCTSARTPPERIAPFTFVRVGPDVALPLLGSPRPTRPRSSATVSCTAPRPRTSGRSARRPGGSGTS